jgi:hypothetical protein
MKGRMGNDVTLLTLGLSTVKIKGMQLSSRTIEANSSAKSGTKFANSEL